MRAHPPSAGSRPAVLLRDCTRFWHDRELKSSLDPASSISSQEGLVMRNMESKLTCDVKGVHELPVLDELSSLDELL